MNLSNVSKDWSGSTRQERRVIQRLLEREQKPTAITYFSKNCGVLSDYWYWFILSTLWVSYTGWSNIEFWKELFNAKRSNRKTSIMKPDELKAFDNLPNSINVYRAHRAFEIDWISYTINPETAAKFAAQRGVDHISEYKLSKSDCIALFLRRGEFELIMLDKKKAIKTCDIEVVIKEP